jgi:hypothetical protein
MRTILGILEKLTEDNRSIRILMCWLNLWLEINLLILKALYKNMVKFILQNLAKFKRNNK